MKINNILLNKTYYNSEDFLEKYTTFKKRRRNRYGENNQFTNNEYK